MDSRINEFSTQVIRMIKIVKRLILWVVFFVVSPIYIFLCFVAAILVRVLPSHRPEKGRERLVWGSEPIINNSYWSRAMRQAGYASETFTTEYYSAYLRSDWDRLLQEQYLFLPSRVKPFVAFLHALFKYDVFFIPFSGFFLGKTPLSCLQASILKLANKKIVVIPIGSDAYIYRRIRSTSIIHGLIRIPCSPCKVMGCDFLILSTSRGISMERFWPNP